MDALIDSSQLLGRPDALRDAVGRDGYVLVRSLLPGGAVDAARRAVLDRLAEGGWVDETGVVVNDLTGTSDRDPVHQRAAGTAEFNRLPYLSELAGLLRDILGDAAFSYPSKVLRATPPQRYRTESGRYVHQDFAFWGINDMMTTWVPLMEISEAVGGLALKPGSQLEPPRTLALLDPSEPGWATSTYRPGDVLVFHCLTAHAALPNLSERLRLSADFRWQRLDEPVSRELICGSLDGTEELFANRFAREPWWRPVPAGIRMTETSTEVTPPPGPSRLFEVHPAWQGWTDPRAE